MNGYVRWNPLTAEKSSAIIGSQPEAARQADQRLTNTYALVKETVCSHKGKISSLSSMCTPCFPPFSKGNNFHDLLFASLADIKPCQTGVYS